jgi:hypothetical protein
MTKGFRHGLRYTPEYRVWINMRQRCNNPRSKDSIYYKNVEIDPAWDDPVQFIADMGTRPSINHQIDRVDNTKGYSKANCRWVERRPQMQNTRISKWWIVNGVRYASLSEASAAVGVAVSRIKAWCEGRSDGGYSYPPKTNCWSEKKYAP